MFSFWRRGRDEQERQIVVRSERPDFVYAVGDVHGCLDQLRRLEDQIDAHIEAQGQNAVIVYLGDYVDRGPNSSGVVRHLLRHRSGSIERVMLGGNHEVMMLDFLSNPKPGHSWLKFGGEETLASYGIDPTALFDGGRRLAGQKLVAHIPDDHQAFLRERACSISFPGIALVHAGLRPGVPLDQQLVQDMLWSRFPENTFAEAQPFGLLVHGHTPGEKPVVEAHRICVDTGAYATGVLTAVCVDRDGKSEFLSVGPMK